MKVHCTSFSVPLFDASAISYCLSTFRLAMHTKPNGFRLMLITFEDIASILANSYHIFTRWAFDKPFFPILSLNSCCVSAFSTIGVYRTQDPTTRRFVHLNHYLVIAALLVNAVVRSRLIWYSGAFSLCGSRINVWW